MPSRPITRLLIANRGEIAVRIARACRALGIVPVAVASEADAGALHTRVAAETVAIGPPRPSSSYLNMPTLIEAAMERRCEAIHPGYGFLSQSAAFADAVRQKALIFVGPPASAMRLMGDKMAARRSMTAAGVPVIPGYEGSGDEDGATLASEADRIGYPVLVKAAGGGGGRGMRLVREHQEIGDAVESARREAGKAFGDARLYLEKSIEGARHVEIQVLADDFGDCIHLFERECSLQRRFQKLIEESPSPFLDAKLRGEMGAAAVAAARACGYVNAGTIEFLVGPDRQFFFLEMNTRIQVEHPVTELTTGVDLVKAQIRIAAGDPLPVRQEDLHQTGHALECRVNAEDPGNGFAPSAGRILFASFPSGDGIRVDAGVGTGDVVSSHYDSLLAKIIVHAESRASALAKMQLTLKRTAVLGVETNLPFLRRILADPVVLRGEATTSFVERDLAGWRPENPGPSDEALVAVAVSEALLRAAVRGTPEAIPDEDDENDRFSPWSRSDRFRTGAA